MESVLSLVLLISYAVTYALRNSYQFKENRGDVTANKKWHFWQGGNQLCFYSLVGLSLGLNWAVAGALLFWVLFDIIVSISLGKHFWYLGDTARLDIFFKKFLGERLTFILKIILLIAATYVATKF